MIDILANIDSNITIAINSVHCDYMDQFMYLFTGRFVWIPMYAMILVLLYKKYNWQKTVVFAIGIGLTILITDQTIATYIRPVIERLRPANLENPISEFIHVVNDYRGGAYGFPSCHAANSFALATFMIMTERKMRFVLFIFAWAFLNSYSRLYLGVHYFGDLIVGAILGSIIAALCFTMTEATAKVRLLHCEDRSATDKTAIARPMGCDYVIITGILTTIIISIISLCHLG